MDNIEKLLSEAAEAGDIIMAAICARAIGQNYSDFALSDSERIRVNMLSVDAARVLCMSAIRDAEAGRDQV